jgi:hypothetical protein
MKWMRAGDVRLARPSRMYKVASYLRNLASAYLFDPKLPTDARLLTCPPPAPVSHASSLSSSDCGPPYLSDIREREEGSDDRRLAESLQNDREEGSVIVQLKTNPVVHICDSGTEEAKVNSPEQPDEAYELDSDARYWPFEEYHQASSTISGSSSIIRQTIATHMPPKKHRVPRHFSRLEKK